VAADGQPLATDAHLLYDFNVPNHEVLSREDLVAETIDEVFREEYKIVDTPIAALKLRKGMVLRVGGKLRVVISVRYDKKNSEDGVVVETSSGIYRVARNSRINVWYMRRKPFIMVLPPNHAAAAGIVPPNLTPAHDAAGIVPVWRGPTRLT
jgi:hypothetical protein